jgi:hypothetical protein
VACRDVLTITRASWEQRRRPFIVEFVGTPGSGKTTLALRLVALLEQHGVPAGTVVDAARPAVARTRAGQLLNAVPSARVRRALLWWAFYAMGVVHAVLFVRERRELVSGVVRSQLRRSLPLRRKLHILFWYLQLCGRYRFLVRSTRPGAVLVIDDGFVHRAVTLHTSHCERPIGPAISRYLDHIPRPDVTVLTIADRDVCECRIHDRGIWKHSRNLSKAELARYVDNCELGADLAVTDARRRGWVVVGLENSRREFARVEADLARVIAHCITGSQTVNWNEKDER